MKHFYSSEKIRIICIGVRKIYVRELNAILGKQKTFSCHETGWDRLESRLYKKL